MIRRLIYFAAAFVIATSFFSVFGQIAVYANPAEGRQQVKPERGDGKEYYYYDGNDVYGQAGQYQEPVKFTIDETPLVFSPEQDSMEVNPAITKAVTETCSSGSVPTKLWDKASKTGSDQPAIYLNIMEGGGAELDLKDDQEDGVFRWGKISDSVPRDRESLPDSISGGTLAKDHTGFTRSASDLVGEVFDGGLTGEGGSTGKFFDGGLIGGNTIHIQNDDIECAFFYFNHFNRLIAPYDDTTTALRPLAGHILGIKGMAFAEYTKRADNRLLFYAYMQAARENTTNHCNIVADSHRCINAVDNTVQRCYADASGASRLLKFEGNLQEESEWDTQLDQEKFVTCFEQKQELVDDGFFQNTDHLTRFIEQVVQSVVPPPSINPLEPDPIAATTDTNTPAPAETQCSLGMLGWILCPVFNFVASMNDMVFSILRNWLTLAPFQQDPGGPNSAAYSTWQQARNIVNSFFIVFFMIMIFSQVTGRGIQSYGIRALMPRIIVGAFLVNLSYVICGVAVDISNAMGDSIYRILNNTSVEGAQIGTGISDGGWQNVTAAVTLLGGAAAGTLIVLGNLAALAPIMIMAFVALMSTFLILLFRQALIIILVAFAPFAFILFILPNTKSLFSKWRTIFTQLLLLYPAFAILFAGSQLAAQVVRDTSAQEGNELMTIFSLGIQVIPLFLLPLLMKLGGGILNRFGGIVNNPTKGVFDKAKNRAEEFQKDQKVQQQTRALNGRLGALGYGAFIRKNQRRQHQYASHKRNAARAQQRYLATQQQRIGDKAVGAFAGKELRDQIRDHIQSSSLKEALEEYEAEKVLIEHDIVDFDDAKLQQMATRQGDYANISDAEQAAAMDHVFQSGNIKAVEQMLEQLYAESESFTQLQKEVILKAAESSGIGESAAHLSVGNLSQTLEKSDIASGQLINTAYQNADERGLFSQATMATQDAATYEGLHKAMSDNVITGANAQAIKDNYQAATKDNKLRTYMTASTREKGRELGW